MKHPSRSIYVTDNGDDLTPEETHMPAPHLNLWNESEAEKSRKAPHRVLMVDGVWMTSMPLAPAA